MKSVGDILGGMDLPEQGRPKARERLARAAEDACPICKGKGFLVLDVPPGHPDFSKVVPCRCTEAKLAQQRAETLRTVSNLGQLSRLSFDNFMPSGVGLSQLASFNLQHAFELAQEFAREPHGWLVLLGGYGCGKTHLAAAIANQRLALGHPAMFVLVPDLLDYLRGAFAPDSGTSLDERLDAIRDAPLLILDDLGAHNSTPWAQEKLFQIINHRYNGRLPTVITSNQRLEDLDPRITSRLVDFDLSKVYEILASDFRSGGAPKGSGASLSTLDLYKDKTFDTFDDRRKGLEPDERDLLARAVARARSYAEEPTGWLVLSGGPGTGKTHLAAAIANRQLALVSQGRPMPMFVVVSDLLDHLRATFGPSSGTTIDRLFDQVRSAPLLILDDFSTESATPWAREKLFQLLNHRYVTGGATVITTGDTVDSIDERLRTRMLDPNRSAFYTLDLPPYYGPKANRSTKNPSPPAGPAGGRAAASRRGGR